MTDLYVPAWVSDEQLAQMNEQIIGWTDGQGNPLRFVRYPEWNKK